MSGIRLTDDYFKAAAIDLRCDLSAIKAVAHTETKNAGFDEKGRPIILFERHVFYKKVREILGREKSAEFYRLYPDICNPDDGGYGHTSEQWGRFSRAFKLCPNAAMMACSWGSFQEMGFNYADLGFDSVGQFVDAMKSGLEAHLAIFVKSIKVKGLRDELQRHDWKTFARIYNGPKYYENDYDNKMKSAQEKFAYLDKQIIVPASLLTIEDLKRNHTKLADLLEPAEDSIIPNQPLSIKIDAEPIQDWQEGERPKEAENASVGKETEQKTVTEVVNAPPKEKSVKTATTITFLGYTFSGILAIAVGVLQKVIEGGFVSAQQIGEMIINFAANNTKYFFLLIGLIIVSMGLKKFYKQITLWKQMDYAARKDMNNVEVKPQ